MTEQEKKIKALQDLQMDLDKTYGKGSMFNMDSDSFVDCKKVSSGSISLDIALGGGYGAGRVVVVYGAESSGKTTLAQIAMKEIQEKEGHVGICDSEHAFNKSYAQQLGVDTSKLWISQPDSLEDCWGIMQKWSNKGVFDMIVYDSVEGAASKKEIEGDIDESNMGVRAKQNNKGLRTVGASLNKHGTVFFVINQVREKIGVVYGSNEVLPGGKGWNFFASQKIRLSKVKPELKDKNNNVIGYTLRASVKKNKIGMPFLTADIPIIIGHGVDKELDLLRVAARPDIAVIDKKGTWFDYEGSKIGQGEINATQTLRDNPEMYEEVYNKVREKAFGVKDWVETE